MITVSFEDLVCRSGFIVISFLCSGFVTMMSVVTPNTFWAPVLVSSLVEVDILLECWFSMFYSLVNQ